MKLPKELTTVTKTSKILAFIVFITLPFLGFFAGMNYQASLNSISQTSTTEPILPKRIPTPTPSQTINTSTRKTYTNTKYGFQLKFPEEVFTSCNTEVGEFLLLRREPYTCPNGANDAGYTIGIHVKNKGAYKAYKTPTKSEKINIDDREATKNNYVYTEEDGPLFSYKESTEVLIEQDSNIISATLFGNDSNNINYFDQILQTFKFTNP